MRSTVAVVSFPSTQTISYSGLAVRALKKLGSRGLGTSSVSRSIRRAWHLSGIALSASLRLSTAARVPAAIKPARTFTLVVDLREPMADTPPLEAVRAAPARVLRACIVRLRVSRRLAIIAVDVSQSVD